LKVKDQVPDRAKVVCVLTGNGLKDPDTAIKSSLSQCQTGIAPDLKSVATAMGF
jgi:threonine synthase